MNTTSTSFLAETIGKSKRIIIITGAGISTNAGIPDFRTAKKGLYAALDGKDTFDASIVFKDTESISKWVRQMANLKVLIEKAKASKSHDLFARLSSQQKVLGWYTQNIDCLEDGLGIDPGVVVRLHGSLKECRGFFCGHVVPWTPSHTQDYLDGHMPVCSNCSSTQVSTRGRILAREKCRLRPNLVLYNEYHPWGSECEAHFTHSLEQNPDLLIVVGTSLAIPTLNEWISSLSKICPTSVYVNLEAPPSAMEHCFSHVILSDCDQVFGPVLELLTGNVATAAGVRKKQFRQAPKESQRFRKLFKEDQ